MCMEGKGEAGEKGGGGGSSTGNFFSLVGLGAGDMCKLGDLKIGVSDKIC